MKLWLDWLKFQDTKLIETTVGFPREERIETMVRFSLIIRQKLIETTVRFPR